MAGRRNIFPATHEKGLEVYFRDINRYPLLSREEEGALAVRIRQGDEEALRHLVRANLRFVVSVAKRYTGQGLQLSDLINEGNLGLLKAARRFDETRSYRFISYAVWWIRQAILQALAEQSRVVKVPQNQVGKIHKVTKAEERLTQKLGRGPEVDEIAAMVQMKKSKVERARSVAAKPVLLDSPVAAGKDGTHMDLLAGDESDKPDTRISRESFEEEVREALRHLYPKEREVIRRYFGVGEETSYTLDDIGMQLGITRERVRQLRDRALNKLRSGTLEKLRERLPQ